MVRFILRENTPATTICFCIMASTIALGCFLVNVPLGSTLSTEDMDAQSYDFLMGSDECSTGEQSRDCALELLQVGVRGFLSHSEALQSSTSATLESAPSSSWTPSNQEQLVYININR